MTSDQPASQAALAMASSTHMEDVREKPGREWLGLRELSMYANVSERTLRAWIRSPRDPLPAARVCGKLLVRWSEFDNYMDRHRVQPLAAINLDRIVQDVLGEGR